jgi:hypothetical protein
MGSKELDPMSCLPKKNTKYAAETEEVYLVNLGGTSLSPNFQYFTNLSVLWLNNNLLTRLDGTDACFRLRELYIENNRLVTLAFLRSFKFLRTLLASNNQIRNLDKNLDLMARSSFLKKLDLFGNPVAEEPDYRLRMIYHVPQVELLDRSGVTLPQRQRADEVVPNMDKVAASEPVKEKKKAFVFSETERDCFRTAKDIRTRRVEAAEKALSSKLFTTHLELCNPPRNKPALANADKWSCGLRLVQNEMSIPTPYEKNSVMPDRIKEMAGKDELTKEDVDELARRLHLEGIEHVGRSLSTQDVFEKRPDLDTSKFLTLEEAAWKNPTSFPAASRSMGTTGGRKPPPSEHLERLTLDPAATIPTKELITYLLSSFDWPRWDDETLDERIKQHHSAARFAEFQGDEAIVAKSRDAMMRLEGVKTRKQEVNLVVKPEVGTLYKTRSDVFSQSFLQATRGIDEMTGRTMVKVEKQGRTTKICG